LLDHAIVRLVRPMANEVCERSSEGAAAHCPSSPDVVVQRSSVVIDGRYHSCITAGPSHAAPLTITWNVPAGGELIFGAGISDTTQAHGAGATLDVRARVDGEDAITLAVPNGRAWVEGRAPIDDGEHEIEVRVAQASGSQRELCFDAIVR
jgi:hypothetical protein